MFNIEQQRAIEISESPDMKHVTHNGQRIYIEHVNTENNTARIHPLDDPQNVFEVQLESLRER